MDNDGVAPSCPLSLAMAQSHKRARVSAAASCAVAVLSLASLPRIHAATTCAAKVQAALNVFEGDGVGVSCCKPNAPECKLSITGDCDDVYSTYGWCLGAGASKACAISYSTDADDPCGAYAGPAGSTFGMVPVGTGYKVPLQSPAIESALQTNWARLSTLSDAGLCCYAADVDGAAACHVGSVLMTSQNPCNKGEYELKCYGTATHGLCTAYKNVSATTEIGQYYLINFDENAPTTSGSTMTTSQSSTTGSASPSGSQASDSGVAAPGPSPSDAAGSSKSSINIAAIVVPIVLALMLLGLGVWFMGWRRRRAARPLTGVSDNAVDPFPATRASHRTQWSESLSMSHLGSPATPYMSPTTPSGPAGKYAQIQHEQQRPMSPALPPYSLYSAS